MRHKGLSGFSLKMIALVTMLVDHLAAGILARYLLYYQYRQIDCFLTADNYRTWLTIYQVMRGIGRMAFPIYCFLLVEGFMYTRNVKKYIGRLLGFALLSEIPFDMCFRFQVMPEKNFFTVFPLGDGDSFREWLKYMMEYNNVFWTLFLGLLTLVGIRFVEEHFKLSKASMFLSDASFVLRQLLEFAVAAVGMFLAGAVLKTDYGAVGVLSIVVIYWFRDRRILGFATAVVVLGLFSSVTEFLALFMLVPLYFYNGTRGRQMKYVFYGFYPVHLLAIGIAAWLLIF